jgi:hypothetical protein
MLCGTKGSAQAASWHTLHNLQLYKSFFHSKHRHDSNTYPHTLCPAVCTPAHIQYTCPDHHLHNFHTPGHMLQAETVLLGSSLNNMWWQYTVTIYGNNMWWQLCGDNKWWQYVVTICGDNYVVTIMWWQYVVTIRGDNMQWQYQTDPQPYSWPSASQEVIPQCRNDFTHFKSGTRQR